MNITILIFGVVFVAVLSVFFIWKIISNIVALHIGEKIKKNKEKKK